LRPQRWYFRQVSDGVVCTVWIDGNTVLSTERSSRLRKERDTHCVPWNLAANVSLITGLRGLYHHSSWNSTTVLRGLYHGSSLSRLFVAFSTVLRGLCHASPWEPYHYSSRIASILLSIMAPQISVCRPVISITNDVL